MKHIFTIPNILTFIRLIISPIMLPILIVYLLPFNFLWLNAALAAIFALFSLTDFFDGYLARRYEQVTAFGKALDPIADKFLVFSTLVALLAIQKIFFVWVLVLIGREFFVLGIRQLALENNFAIHVSWWAKLKTVSQMCYLTFLIYNPYHTTGFGGFSWFVRDFYQAPGYMTIELLLTILAIGLSVLSAQRYYQSFMQEYRIKQLS